MGGNAGEGRQSESCYVGQPAGRLPPTAMRTLALTPSKGGGRRVQGRDRANILTGSFWLPC